MHVELQTLILLTLQLKEKFSSFLTPLYEIQCTYLTSAGYAELYHLFREAVPATSFAATEMSYSQEEMKAVLSFLAATPKMPVRTTASSSDSSVVRAHMTIEELDDPVASQQSSSNRVD